MKITHFGHSCVLVEAADQRVLIDPGTFSDAWHTLTDLDAVIVTHLHPDHIDADRIPQLLRANPNVEVWAEPHAAASAPGFPMRPFTSADTIVLGELTLAGVGEKHAVIHADLPRVGNTGVVVTAPDGVTLFHPGDAIDAQPTNVDILAVPINAPWCAMKETVEFVRRVQPARLLPIHDGLLQNRGRQLYTTQIENLGGVPVWRIEEGTPTEAPPRVGR